MGPLEQLATTLLQLVATVTARPSLNATQTAMLGEDMPRDVIRTRVQAGTTLSYVDGWYVITRLNEVFGFDGWDFEVTDVTSTVVDKKTVVSLKGTLIAGRVRRSDIGAAVSAGASAEALETAYKAAATDAMKRCARTFGASLGLALYDKEQRTVGMSTKALALLDQLAVAPDVKAWRKEHDAELFALNREDKEELNAAIATRRAELNSAPPRTAPPQNDSPGKPPGSPTPSAAPSAPSPLQHFLGRILKCSTLDEVAAIAVAAGGLPTLQQEGDRRAIWKAVCARAAALGENGEVFASRVTTAKKNGSAGDWTTVAAILREVAECPDAKKVDKIADTYAQAYKRLPKPLQAVVWAGLKARREQTAAPVDELLTAAGRATTADELSAIQTRAEQAAQRGAITPDQALAVQEALGERAGALGIGVEQEQAA